MDFESYLVPEDNGKQYPNESLANKYQKRIACSYGYKSLCVYDKFSKSFKSYLREDMANNFISRMIEKCKYCTDVIKKHFSKELVMTKEDNGNFPNSTKCWICDNTYSDSNHCHITQKYKGSAHRDCNINVKLNQKSPVVYHNLKSYNSHLVMQELGKFNLKIIVIPNGLEKYTRFGINKKLSFIDSSHF